MVMDGIFRIVISTLVIHSIASPLHAVSSFSTLITFDVDGTEMQNNGVYLEVIPNEKLVFTDTYTVGWKPAPEPFMTAIVTFEDAGPGHTRYRAVARHRSAETAKQHADMGFQDGWGTVATQLESYAQGLMA